MKILQTANYRQRRTSYLGMQIHDFGKVGEEGMKSETVYRMNIHRGEKDVLYLHCRPTLVSSFRTYHSNFYTKVWFTRLLPSSLPSAG